MMTKDVAVGGAVVASGISHADYMARYAADFCEWVGGMVIKMPPVMFRHKEIIAYLLGLFNTYFELRPSGQVAFAPFVMRLPEIEVSREPDLQLILNDNPGQLTDTAMIGPADSCIEVVSPESVGRDHGEKFAEYETAGVGKYWIIDPLRNEVRFYRLNADGVYARQEVDSFGVYTTPRLPDLLLHVPTLWQEALPGPLAVARAVEQMLNPSASDPDL